MDDGWAAWGNQPLKSYDEEVPNAPADRPLNKDVAASAAGSSNLAKTEYHTRSHGSFYGPSVALPHRGASQHRSSMPHPQHPAILPRSNPMHTSPQSRQMPGVPHPSSGSNGSVYTQARNNAPPAYPGGERQPAQIAAIATARLPHTVQDRTATSHGTLRDKYPSAVASNRQEHASPANRADHNRHPQVPTENARVRAELAAAESATSLLTPVSSGPVPTSVSNKYMAAGRNSQSVGSVPAHRPPSEQGSQPRQASLASAPSTHSAMPSASQQLLGMLNTGRSEHSETIQQTAPAPAGNPPRQDALIPDDGPSIPLELIIHLPRSLNQEQLAQLDVFVFKIRSQPGLTLGLQRTRYPTPLTRRLPSDNEDSSSIAASSSGPYSERRIFLSGVGREKALVFIVNWLEDALQAQYEPRDPLTREVLRSMRPPPIQAQQDSTADDPEVPIVHVALPAEMGGAALALLEDFLYGLPEQKGLEEVYADIAEIGDGGEHGVELSGQGRMLARRVVLAWLDEHEARRPVQGASAHETAPIEATRDQSTPVPGPAFPVPPVDKPSPARSSNQASRRRDGNRPTRDGSVRATFDTSAPQIRFLRNFPKNEPLKQAKGGDRLVNRLVELLGGIYMQMPGAQSKGGTLSMRASTSEQLRVAVRCLGILLLSAGLPLSQEQQAVMRLESSDYGIATEFTRLDAKSPHRPYPTARIEWIQKRLAETLKARLTDAMPARSSSAQAESSDWAERFHLAFSQKAAAPAADQAPREASAPAALDLSVPPRLSNAPIESPVRGAPVKKSASPVHDEHRPIALDDIWNWKRALTSTNHIRWTIPFTSIRPRFFGPFMGNLNMITELTGVTSIFCPDADGGPDTPRDVVALASLNPFPTPEELANLRAAIQVIRGIGILLSGTVVPPKEAIPTWFGIDLGNPLDEDVRVAITALRADIYNAGRHTADADVRKVARLILDGPKTGGSGIPRLGTQFVPPEGPVQTSAAAGRPVPLDVIDRLPPAKHNAEALALCTPMNSIRWAMPGTSARARLFGLQCGNVRSIAAMTGVSAIFAPLPPGSGDTRDLPRQVIILASDNMTLGPQERKSLSLAIRCIHAVFLLLGRPRDGPPIDSITPDVGIDAQGWALDVGEVKLVQELRHYSQVQGRQTSNQEMLDLVRDIVTRENRRRSGERDLVRSDDILTTIGWREHVRDAANGTSTGATAHNSVWWSLRDPAVRDKLLGFGYRYLGLIRPITGVLAVIPEEVEDVEGRWDIVGVTILASSSPSPSELDKENLREALKAITALCLVLNEPDHLPARHCLPEFLQAEEAHKLSTAELALVQKSKQRLQTDCGHSSEKELSHAISQVVRTHRYDKWLPPQSQGEVTSCPQLRASDSWLTILS